MNRPKYSVQYGQRSGKNLMFLQYVELLENYCDELEKNKDKQFNHGFNKATNICCEKIIALEKALDNACDMLETYDLANNELTRKKHSRKEWKEWCLKNE